MNGNLNRRGFMAGVAGIAGTVMFASRPAYSASTTLNVWGAVALDRGVGALIEAFSEKYPEIAVNYTQFTNNAEGNLRLDTSLQGGAPIDVFFSYGAPNVARRSQAGYAADLTTFASADENLKQFVSTNPQRTALFDGKLLSLPTVFNPYMVYVNQDLLEKTGIQIPFDWTVEQFHEIGLELIKAADLEAATYKVLNVQTMLLGGNATYTADGKASNFRDPAWQRRWELIMEMENDGSLMSIEQVLAQKVDVYAQSHFLAGRHAFYLDNPATTRFVKDVDNYPHDFRTTFRPMPLVKAGAGQWNEGSFEDSLQIASNSKNPEAAQLFAAFWLGEGKHYLLPAGKIPPSVAVEGRAGFDAIAPGLLGDKAEELFDTEALADVLFAPDLKLSVTTELTGLSEISSTRNGLEQRLRLGEINIEELTNLLTDEADAIITRERAKA